jgi:phospholipid-binding lipoprotein MlaA
VNAARTAMPLLACIVLAAGCASVPKNPAARAEYNANHDPLEPLNRKTFALNLFLDNALIKPIAKAYQRVVPSKARDAMRHVLDNLNEPIVMGNMLLQARFQDAGKTFARFVANSTAGVGGLIDVATPANLPEQVGDLGQTFWKWGLPDGPYLILPLFGPSNPRDAVGTGGDAYFDPFRYIAKRQDYPNYVSVGRTVIDGVDKRQRNLESVDVIERESVDYYAALRSLFRQNRAAELRGKNPAPTLPVPDLYEDPGR